MLVLKLSLKEPAGQCEKALRPMSVEGSNVLALVRPMLAPVGPLCIINHFNECIFKPVSRMRNESLRPSANMNVALHDLYNDATCLTKYVESSL